ncbi:MULTISPECIES: hypothetical protein [unclassified Mesorhizobium]|uniref:hypothetical protein n=1 Tax=unclassified Mesorhizobium TaxID=325217 RepID=UPI000FCA9237|nr:MULTISPECIES: hypothetical protein [unclassified Mesorhizobium]RUX96141.1 hypothetical protein EN993_08855 [Mesorhizobium sp. M7D.F.Ca.US.004.01.2.1]RVA32555.1 hypothetical protein EN935_11775 [Mesorhizobium sp. M7D.F.Ca.US.004.03.1.1]
MTRYFVDDNGGYLGGFDGEDIELPESGIEVPTAPTDARQTWDGSAWSEPPVARQMVLKSTVMQRLIDVNKMGIAQGALWAQPNAFARWFAPDHPAVYCDDPDAMAFVAALGLDPAIILAS